LISKRDVQLGKIALREGMVTKDQINQCLALKKKLAKTKGKKVALGALLLKKEYLTQTQLEEIIKLHNAAGGGADGDKEDKKKSGRNGKLSKKPSRTGTSARQKKSEKGEKADDAAADGAEEADGEAAKKAARKKASTKRRAKTDVEKARSQRAAKAKAEEAAAADEEAGKRTSARAKKTSARSKSAGKSRVGETSSARKKPVTKKRPKSSIGSMAEADPAIFHSAAEDEIDGDDHRIIACADCGKKYRIKPKQTGKRFKCRRCKSRVKVPKDLFERPIDAGGSDMGASAGLEVDEFSLSSADMEPLESGEGAVGTATAKKPKQSVKAAAAQAQKAIQRVQKETSLSDLIKDAETRRSRPLTPKSTFGVAQMLTIGLCVAGLVGLVGGIVYWKQQAAAAEEAAREARLRGAFDDWKGDLDGALAAAEEAKTRGNPIDIGGAITKLEEVRGAKKDLTGSNLERALAFEEESGVVDVHRELFLAQGRGYLKEGGIYVEDALAAFARAAEIDPSDEDSQLLLARVRIRARRYGDAASGLEGLAGGSEAAKALRGLAYERGEAGSEAAEAYQGLSGAADVLVARAWLVGGQEDKALGALSDGGEGQEAAARHVMRALAHEAKDDPSRAEAAFEAAVRSAGSTTPFALVAQGEYLLRQGKADQALEALQAARSLVPTPRGSLALGDAYLHALQVERARTAYREALGQPSLTPEGALLVAGEVDPFEAPLGPDPRTLAGCRLAALELGARNLEGARGAYLAVLQADPFCVVAHAGLAFVDVLEEVVDETTAGRIERALALSAKLDGAVGEVVHSVESGQVLTFYASFLLNEGRDDAAAEALTEAKAADPSLEPQLTTLRGDYLRRKTYHSDSAMAFKTALSIEVSPTNPSGYVYSQAEAIFESSSPDDGAAMSKVEGGVLAALAFNPFNAHAHLLEARRVVAQGRAEEAVVHLDRAIEVNPFFDEAYVARGFLYARDLPETQRGREAAARALADFELATRLQDSPRAETLYGEALAHNTLNQRGRAMDCCERALALDSGHREARALLEEIKEFLGVDESGGAPVDRPR
jgi:tetratricopeptide (TPR) repeat protein